MPSLNPKHLAEAAVFFAFVGIVRLLDLDRGSAFGGAVGRALARIGRRPRAYENIHTAFPELDRQAATRLIDGMYESYGRMLAEMARLEDYVRPAERTRFTFEGLDNYQSAVASGRPIIIVSGHFGNWEMQVPALHHLGIPFADVTQRLDNPWLDRFISERRRRAGFTKQAPRGTVGTRTIIAGIKAGETVAFMVDLRFREGIIVPLFNKPAYTTFTPALFAQTYGAVVLPMALRRQDGANFQMVFHAPMRPAGSGNDARDIVELTTEINGFVEGEIRARPADWMWNHGRWLPRPQMFRRARQLMDDAAGVRPDDRPRDGDAE